MSRAVVLIRSSVERARAVHWAQIAPWGTSVTFEEGKRSIPQNKRFWAMLTDVARQKEHCGRKYPPEVWKCLFFHAWGMEVKFIPSLDGDSVIPMMYRSSQLTKKEMIDLQEFIAAWGAQNGVIFKGDKHDEEHAPEGEGIQPENEDAGL